MPHIVPGEVIGELVLRARSAIGISQEELGRRLGASRSTVARWILRGSHPSLDQIASLARMVHPHNAEIASRLAVECGSTLESLGLEHPKEAALAGAAAQRPFPPIALMVDSILYAANEAYLRAGGEVREILRVAFQRASELGLSTQEIEAALSPPAASETPPLKQAAPQPGGRRARTPAVS